MRILIIPLIVLLAACTCKHEGHGYVYDEKTKQPIMGARIEVYLSSVHGDTLFPPVYTDTQGHFQYAHTFCHDFFQVQKDSFISYTTLDKQGDTLWMERLDEFDFSSPTAD